MDYRKVNPDQENEEVDQDLEYEKQRDLMEHPFTGLWQVQRKQLEILL